MNRLIYILLSVFVLIVSSVSVTFAADAINLSSRANIGTGQEKLNTSVVVVGSGASEFLAKAVGPSMAAKGVQGTLQDPVLRIVDLQSMTVIADVDDWQDDAQMADRLTSLGLAPEDAREAATIVSLSAGSYSVQVTGSGETTGIGQASIRELSFVSMPAVSAFNGLWQSLDYDEMSLQITAYNQEGGEYMIANLLESLPGESLFEMWQGPISGSSAMVSISNSELDGQLGMQLLSGDSMQVTLVSCVPGPSADPETCDIPEGTVFDFERVY